MLWVTRDMNVKGHTGYECCESHGIWMLTRDMNVKGHTGYECCESHGIWMLWVTRDMNVKGHTGYECCESHGIWMLKVTRDMNVLIGNDISQTDPLTAGFCVWRVFVVAHSTATSGVSFRQPPCCWILVRVDGGVVVNWLHPCGAADWSVIQRRRPHAAHRMAACSMPATRPSAPRAVSQCAPWEPRVISVWAMGTPCDVSVGHGNPVWCQCGPWEPRVMSVCAMRTPWCQCGPCVCVTGGGGGGGSMGPWEPRMVPVCPLGTPEGSSMRLENPVWSQYALWEPRMVPVCALGTPYGSSMRLENPVWF